MNQLLLTVALLFDVAAQAPDFRAMADQMPEAEQPVDDQRAEKNAEAEERSRGFDYVAVLDDARGAGPIGQPDSEQDDNRQLEDKREKLFHGAP